MSKKDLMVRKHPKLSTQNVVGNTSDWQHGFICACRFHNWLPDMQIGSIEGKFKLQQVSKRKDDRKGISRRKHSRE